VATAQAEGVRQASWVRRVDPGDRADRGDPPAKPKNGSGADAAHQMKAATADPARAVAGCAGLHSVLASALRRAPLVTDAAATP
jgi:hypothetical protein